MKLYKIGDICDLLDITPRTIRYYDQLGLLPNTKRSDGYTRLFDQHDIDTIKSIRSLQKSHALPLNAIKNRLFPTNLDSNDILLITDSFSQETLFLSPHLTVLPLDQGKFSSKSSKQLGTLLQNYISKSMICICFFHQSLLDTYTSLEKQFSDNTFFLYPLNHYAMTHYMMSRYIHSNLNRFTNLNELNLMIKRFITLGFSLCLLDSLDTYVSIHSQYNVPDNYLNAITAYRPILLSTHESQSIVSFHRDFPTNINHIAITFDTLLQNQKRYVQDACIFYTHSKSFAQTLQKALLIQCPNLEFSIEKINNWSHEENEVNFISII